MASLLRGDVVPRAAFDVPPADLLHACNDEGVAGLLYERIRALSDECGWRDIGDALRRDIRSQAAAELLRHRELISVLNRLASADLFPIVMKGTALAYSLYETPSSRPRIDTDLLVRRDDVDRFRRALAAIGYTAPLHCDGDLLFCQFPMQRTSEAGVVHRFDCHWKISTQSPFANVLTFDEIAERAIPLPALGSHARTLAPLDALLLACIHPAMHHRNDAPLVWVYDIHLLVSALSREDLERFAERAIARKISAICAYQLRSTRDMLGTPIPDSIIDRMTAVRQHEPSAAYLRPNRRWIDELVSSVRGLPRWTERLQLLREIAFPHPSYMLQAYGFARSARGVALLPLLYIHRVLAGGWKIVAGLK